MQTSSIMENTELLLAYSSLLAFLTMKLEK